MSTVTGYLTAISRKTPPEPLRYIKSKGLIVGRALDYGCGRKPWFDMLGYDPHWKPGRPTGKFDTIVCNYVLNVVPPEIEKEILEDIKYYLKNSGIAYISVRRDLPKEGKAGRGTWQRHVTLNLPVLHENGTRAIYILKKASKTKRNPMATCECEDVGCVHPGGCQKKGTVTVTTRRGKYLLAPECAYNLFSRGEQNIHSPFAVRSNPMENYEIIKASEWDIGGRGQLPSRVVMGKITAELHGLPPYCTHVEVEKENGSFDMIWGHYNLTKAQAEKDYKKRSKSMGVKANPKKPEFTDEQKNLLYSNRVGNYVYLQDGSRITLKQYLSRMKKASKRNPGEAWHLAKANSFADYSKRARKPDIKNMYNLLEDDEKSAAKASKALGMPNPGEQWHRGQMLEQHLKMDRHPADSTNHAFHRGAMVAHEFSAMKSHQQHLSNPRRRKRRRNPSGSNTLLLLGAVGLGIYILKRRQS